MPNVKELATVTSKGQLTLPKAVRQALGVEAGDKVAFELREDGQVVVSRGEAEHEDPATTSACVQPSKCAALQKPTP